MSNLSGEDHYDSWLLIDKRRSVTVSNLIWNVHSRSFEESGISYRFDPKFGLYLGALYNDTEKAAKYISASLSESPLGSGQRLLFSTYASALEIMLNAPQPSGTDYIIHNLGHAARNQYISQFKDFSPRFVTTLRSDFIDYESWIQFSYWPLYKAILANYEPVLKTAYSIIWQRADSKISSIPLTLLPCVWSTSNSQRTNFYIDSSQVNTPGLLDVTLTYELKREGYLNSLISRLTRIRVQRERGRNETFVIPSHESEFNFPLSLLDEGKEEFQIELTPRLSHILTVKRCEVYLLEASKVKLSALGRN